MSRDPRRRTRLVMLVAMAQARKQGCDRFCIVPFRIGGLTFRSSWIFVRWVQSYPPSSTITGSRSFLPLSLWAIISSRQRCASSEKLFPIWKRVSSMVDCESGTIRRRWISADDRHSQCEAMTAHYEICILLIEFEEDKFSLRVSPDICHMKAGSKLMSDPRGCPPGISWPSSQPRPRPGRLFRAPGKARPPLPPLSQPTYYLVFIDSRVREDPIRPQAEPRRTRRSLRHSQRLLRRRVRRFATQYRE
jgi:hypothetical protein